MTYDSTQDTMDHIGKVRQHIATCVDSLQFRAQVHDASKLLPPEKEAFDEVTPQLRGLTYGSDEYKASIARLGPALEHHYFVNSHHPEHYINGIKACRYSTCWKCSATGRPRVNVTTTATLHAVCASTESGSALTVNWRPSWRIRRLNWNGRSGGTP